MTTKRKAGIALIVVGVLMYLFLSITKAAFDYPLLLIVSVLLFAVGLTLALLGRSKDRHRVGSHT